MRAWLVAAMAVTACGAPGSGDQPDGRGSDDPDAAVDALPPGWSTLVQRDWSVPAGTDRNLCRRVMIEQDMYVTGFRAMSPTGTHHEMLTISNTASPLGDYDCTAANLDPQLMFAGGVNTDDLLFPTGVAIKLTAGQYVNLNLHLYNGSDDMLTGTSGVYVKTVEPSEVVHEADLLFAGNNDFTIPATNAPETRIGSCVAPTTWNVFTLWPHMHQWATHQKVVVRRAGQLRTTLLDSAYEFAEQRNYPMGEYQVQINDEIEVSCTYVNDTSPARELSTGETADKEMCVTGMYKWPKGGSAYCMSSGN